MTARAPVTRPALRGWSHAVAVLPATVGAIALVVVSHGNAARQISLAIYGAALILLFSVSALYHRGPWTPRGRARWRRVDRSMIFVAIAGTYTPVVANLLQGWTAVALLALIWSLALGGVVIVGAALPVPPPVLVGLYVAVGWTAVGFFPALISSVDPVGLLAIVLAGVLYSAGAVVYALQRPTLWPRVFGYHEVFHLFVIAASAVLFAFIAGHVATASR